MGGEGPGTPKGTPKGKKRAGEEGSSAHKSKKRAGDEGPGTPKRTPKHKKGPSGALVYKRELEAKVQRMLNGWVWGERPEGHGDHQMLCKIESNGDVVSSWIQDGPYGYFEGDYYTEHEEELLKEKEKEKVGARLKSEAEEDAAAHRVTLSGVQSLIKRAGRTSGTLLRRGGSCTSGSM
ncbi:hypothetical protein EJ06DRAFT_31023 [Trichodelitschia bisporula]|uniref:Uncharacterized protein n=1 Tax=Trichodelitschia bisporula TaxID=703511 RepID=A0A6G1IBD9_9PEZI|nr:hypothetical protein EJ06DRAFT_31023 [Trichodelitschia bisporula]